MFRHAAANAWHVRMDSRELEQVMIEAMSRTGGATRAACVPVGLLCGSLARGRLQEKARSDNFVLGHGPACIGDHVMLMHEAALDPT